MKTNSKLLGVLLAVVGSALSGNAVTVFTFDDVSPPDSMSIPNGYGGMNWDNFFIQYGPNVLPNGIVSSPNYAGNNFGLPAVLSSDSAFNLVSGYFSSIYAANSDILTVEGFQGTTSVYRGDYYISHDHPTLITFNFMNVSSVRFSTANGNFFALDNLTVEVPEPGSAALVSVAFAAAGLTARRRWLSRWMSVS